MTNADVCFPQRLLARRTLLPETGLSDCLPACPHALIETARSEFLKPPPLDLTEDDVTVFSVRGRFEM